MALKSIAVIKPGSGGLNTTEEVPAAAESLVFASQATNVVVDQTGKASAREDFVNQTSGYTGTIRGVYCHVKQDNTNVVVSQDTTAIYTGTSTLTSILTNASAGNYQFASFNGKLYAVQASETAQVFAEAAFAAESFTGAPWTSPNTVLAAYGRVWMADDAAGSNQRKIWWSDTLNGKVWNSGDAGSLDLTNVFPNGSDRIVALAAHSNRLIILCRNCVIIYQMSADLDPATMTLQDPILIGCIARDSVVNTGTDLVWLSDVGVQSLARLTTVASQFTVGDLTKNTASLVKTDVAAATLTNVRAGYHPTYGWYLLSFPDSNETFVLNLTRRLGDNITPIVTVWNNDSMPFYGFILDASRNFYTGGTNGIFKYTGYTSDGAAQAYSYTVWTPWMNFGTEDAIKNLKELEIALKAKSGQSLTLSWKTDYLEGTTNSVTVTCDSTEFAEDPGIGTVKCPIGRSCKVVKIGVSGVIAAQGITLHSIRVLATAGKLSN